MIKTKEFRSPTEDWERAVVEYGVRKLAGNPYGYFSVTGEFYAPGDRKNKPSICGCVHEYIQEVTHEFDDLIALHLSDEHGVPLHAYANGRYYLDHPEEFSDEVVAKHFRIGLGGVGELRFLHTWQLKDWVEAQKPRWAEEARKARERHGV